jgi:uncharacterized damage-inducible protein DinB
MATMSEAMLGEFRQEAATTRRVLERVPEEKLAWKPHPKSMSLGQLANHIAMIPGGLSKVAQLSEFDIASAKFTAPDPRDVQEILNTLDESVKTASAYFAGLSDADAMATWKFVNGDKTLMAMPRAAMIRGILLNHWYHHRGQLSVYLRLLDVSVPAIYGRSADESPFG